MSIYIFKSIYTYMYKIILENLYTCIYIYLCTYMYIHICIYAIVTRAPGRRNHLQEIAKRKYMSTCIYSKVYTHTCIKPFSPLCTHIYTYMYIALVARARGRRNHLQEIPQRKHMYMYIQEYIHINVYRHSQKCVRICICIYICIYMQLWHVLEVVKSSARNCQT